MVNCAVPLCKTNSKIDKTLSFHQFPCDEKRLLLWLHNINKTNPMKPNWSPNQYSTICGLHFMESDFKPFTKNRLLKPDAVPTIFPISKDSKQNVARPKRKRKASVPKKTPNKGKKSSDENTNLMDIEHNSGSAAEHDQADSDVDQVAFEEEQDEAAFEEEQDEAGSEDEQDQAGFDREHNQAVSDEDQDQVGSEADLERFGSDVEYDQAGSDAEHDQVGSDTEKDQAGLEFKKVQGHSSYMTESNQTNTAYLSEKTSKRAKLDPGNISSQTIYPISSAKQFYTPKHLKTLIRESKIKCAEKKLALVKEKLASKVVSRALQKALVVSKIKAETAKSDFYERKKIFLLQTKISHLKNEVPVSEEKFQTMEYLQSKIMEEELATRIEERALQKQLFEAEIQASNEKQTYYVTKKTWLPIFMDHSNMK